jgi:hypothetical protein
MSESGASSLLVTVKISGPQGIATRNLYHLPRVGDHVSFPADDHEPGEMYWIVTGTVRSVLWMDDYIHIDVTMGEELDARARKERGLD